MSADATTRAKKKAAAPPALSRSSPQRPYSLLGLQGMAAPELRGLLEESKTFAQRLGRRDAKLAGTLAGRTVALLLFEDSTRTRTSFSLAATGLGAQVVSLAGSGSSISKGETLADTARNIEALGASVVVVRARQSGAAHQIARSVSCSVVNAGDGKHEHPTQGLLDTLALAAALKRDKGFDLSGLRVGIVGDVLSSRVARSNIAAFTTLGARVECVGPTAFISQGLTALGQDGRGRADPKSVRVGHDLEKALPTLDAVMLLRVQAERHGPQGGSFGPEERPGAWRGINEPWLRSYRELYMLDARRLAMLPTHAVVMHPGPINRGIEMTDAAADSPRSIILNQVESGLAVRMAVLARCVG